MPRNVVKMAQRFKRIYNSANFTGIATADVVCAVGQYTKIGTLTVPAQQAVSFGATDIINGGPTGRQLYMRLDDSTGAELKGLVRFAVANNSETNVQIVLEERTERLSIDQSDRAKCVLFPLDGRFARQDSKLIIYFYPDSGPKTVMYNGTNTKLLIPVTIEQ